MKDTARVLGRMYDAIEYRGSSQHTVHQLAGFAGVPVVNGLTDDFHPTQMLADAPRELWPADDLVSRCEGFAQESGARITITGEPREAVRGVDFVHTDVWVGIEVTEDAFESPADIAFEQAENRMHMIRAVLVAALTRLR